MNHTVEEVKAETVPVRPYIPTNAELYEQNTILMSALADIYAKMAKEIRQFGGLLISPGFVHIRQAV